MGRIGTLSGSTDLIEVMGLFNRPKKKKGFDPREVIQMALGSNNELLSKRGQSTQPGYTRRTSTPVSQGSVVGAAPSAPVDGDSVQRLVQSMAASQFGWSGPEWDALYDLVRRESGWNPNAQNPTSSAAGLFQFLDSTRRNYGITRESPLQDQVRAGLQYIADRYQSPTGALNHWLARKPINGRDVGNWY